jgi:hypothetical protein
VHESKIGFSFQRKNRFPNLLITLVLRGFSAFASRCAGVMAVDGRRVENGMRCLLWGALQQTIESPDEAVRRLPDDLQPGGEY